MHSKTFVVLVGCSLAIVSHGQTQSQTKPQKPSVEQKVDVRPGCDICQRLLILEARINPKKSRFDQEDLMIEVESVLVGIEKIYSGQTMKRDLIESLVRFIGKCNKVDSERATTGAFAAIRKSVRNRELIDEAIERLPVEQKSELLTALKGLGNAQLEAQ